LFNHLYLADSINDILVRMCCMEHLDCKLVNMNAYNEHIRTPIIEHCANTLESY
jgi:hypothetical protein